MRNRVFRKIIDALKFIIPISLYMKHYEKTHADKYVSLMKEVDAPDYYINDPEVRRDYFQCLGKYGLPVKYYKELEFYEMRDDEARRDSYVFPGKLMSTWYGVNSGPSRKILDDKLDFMKVFSDYINREWLYVKEASFKEFKSFMTKHGKVIVKHTTGSGGKGIHLFEYNNQSEEDLKKTYDEYYGDDSILEELIVQKGILHDLNPDSVNCVRICTMRFKDHVEIFQCFLKMGKGKVCVDNASQGGLFAPIDIETGVISRVPYGCLWSEYPIHPVSGIEVKGIQIPCWDKVKQTVLQASEKVPDLIYVSWDVAISDDGQIYIVEGNSCGDGMWLKEGGDWPRFVRAMKSRGVYLKYRLTYNYAIKYRADEVMSYMFL